MSGVTIYIFRAKLDDDDFIIYRDIAVRPNQCMGALVKCILESYNFDENFDAEIHKCDGAGKLISSLNLKTPPILNECIDFPHQEFKLTYNGVKSFYFKISLIKVSTSIQKHFPVCINKEGTPPAQYDPEEVQDLTHLTPKQLLEIKASFR